MNVLYNNTKLTLEKNQVIGVGGEATVFHALQYPDRAFKVYHAADQLRAQKLQAFIKRSHNLPNNVIYPSALLTDARHTAVGYAMKRLKNNWFPLAQLAARKFCTDHNITTKDIVNVFTQLHRGLTSIHAAGMVVGDLNDQNELIRPHDLATAWIDVDSWQFDRYPCMVGTEKYLSPALYKVDLSKAPSFLPEHDWFSFVVLLFRSLLRLHPFQAGFHKQHKSIAQRALHGVTVLDTDVRRPKMGLPPEIASDALLQTMLAHLKRTSHNPFPLSALREYSELLTQCKSCGMWYAGSRSRCPSCTTTTVHDKRLQQQLLGITAKQLLKTPGRILYTTVSAQTIFCLADEHGMTVLYRHSPYGSDRLELFNTIAGAQFSTFDTKLVICPDPYAHEPQLLLLDLDAASAKPFGQTITECFAGGQAIFSCSDTRLYRITGSRIMCGEIFNNQLAEREVLQILPNQTWFTAGPSDQSGNDYVFGFYRVFADRHWFLVHRNNTTFTRHSVAIPKLKPGERLVDIAVKTASDSILVLQKTTHHGSEYLSINIVGMNGKTLFKKRIAISNTTEYENLHNSVYAHGSLMSITDSGIVRENFLNKTTATFKGAEQVTRNDDMLLNYHNKLLVVSPKHITVLSNK